MIKTTSKSTSDPSFKTTPNALHSLTSNDSTGNGLFAGVPFGEYMTDALQRTILFWDVLRQRSDQYYAQ